ncbi:MAG: TatD family hydrolase [Thermoanaerobacteraceae bacterium]|nr:TatD family hydrolase [Thermoanaerobacteraceae bacterium]
MIDTHAHLNDEDFAGDLDAVIDRAVSAGVKAIIVPGSDINTSLGSIGLAQRYSIIHPALGIHPHDAEDEKEKLKVIFDMLSEQKPAAVGEIGLDYHYDFSPRETQKAVFREQLRMAKKFNLPVIVHIRESFDDAYGIMAEEKVERGVVHCFSDGVDEMEKILSLGLYISFTGIITFKNTPMGLMDAVRTVPSDRYMIETDSPYLAPVPYRGKRNEPSYVVEVAKKISEVRKVPIDAVSYETDENTARLFGIR